MSLIEFRCSQLSKCFQSTCHVPIIKCPALRREMESTKSRQKVIFSYFFLLSSLKLSANFVVLPATRFCHQSTTSRPQTSNLKLETVELSQYRYSQLDASLDPLLRMRGSNNQSEDNHIIRKKSRQ